jgi:hypothetical protein
MLDCDHAIDATSIYRQPADIDGQFANSETTSNRAEGL